MELYYTPKIEEFHPEFIYEVHTMTSGGMSILNMEDRTFTKLSEPDIKIWKKAKVTTTMQDTGEMITVPFNEGTLTYKDETFPYDHTSLESIVELLREGRIRVKYLDKEDLESLGFKLISSGWYHQYPSMDKKGYQILYKLGEGFSLSYGVHEHSENIFTGNIQNISELKVLLKQLNIIEL